MVFPGELDAVDETLTDTVDPPSVRGLEPAAPHLFVVLECSRPTAGGSRHSLGAIDSVVIGRGRARSSHRTIAAGKRTLELRVPDPRMSLVHAQWTRRESGFVLEDAASRNGTRVNGARISGAVLLQDGDHIEVGHTILIYRAALHAPSKAPPDVDSADVSNDQTLLGTLDHTLAHPRRVVGRIARSESSILLLGETGTGKELLARAIHRASARQGPFVAVNCGAIPASLVEAQLFGHVRGSFSGARNDAPGLLRSADGGTLLFDEIGDLPAPAQVALLRAIQEREVTPVGGVRPTPVDVRIVAATHQPLPALVGNDPPETRAFDHGERGTIVVLRDASLARRGEGA